MADDSYFYLDIDPSGQATILPVRAIDAVASVVFQFDTTPVSWNFARQGPLTYGQSLSAPLEDQMAITYDSDGALWSKSYRFLGESVRVFISQDGTTPDPLPEPDAPPEPTLGGGYVRHRDRMVQESVFEDLQNTLIACRWLSGSTSRKVVSPDDPSAGFQFLTVTSEQVLPLAGRRDDGSLQEVKLIDYFPEAGGNNDQDGESRKTELNTLAIDTGVAQEPTYIEMGSNAQEQQYIFTMAFYASSDAVALALLNDLRDRYVGRIVSDDNLDLFNFNAPSFDLATARPVLRMEIDGFTFRQNVEEAVKIHEVNLYYAELILTDHIVEGSV